MGLLHVLGWLEPMSLVESSGMKSPDLETQHPDKSDVAALAAVTSINSLREVAESSGEQQLDEHEKKLLHLLCGDVNLNPEEKKQLESLLLEFSHVFASDDEELGCTNREEHWIDTGDSAPI